MLLALSRSMVYLEIDNRQCTQASSECFSNTDLAASYIAAEALETKLHYPLFSVDSMSGLGFYKLYYFCIRFCLFLSCCDLIISKKKIMQHRTV